MQVLDYKAFLNPGQTNIKPIFKIVNDFQNNTFSSLNQVFRISVMEPIQYTSSILLGMLASTYIFRVDGLDSSKSKYIDLAAL